MTPIQQAIAILEEDALTNRIERALEVLRGVPQSPLTREAIAKAIHGRRYQMDAKDVDSMFAWYAEDPSGTDRSRMAIYSALRDADAVLALTRPDGNSK